MATAAYIRLLLCTRATDPESGQSGIRCPHPRCKDGQGKQVLVSCGSHDKALQTGGLKTTEMNSPTVARPEVRDQGVGRVSSFWRGMCPRPAPASRTPTGLGVWPRHSRLPPPARGLLPLHLHSGRPIRTHLSVDLGPTLTQNDLISRSFF